MFSAQGPTHGPESIRLIFLLITAGVVLFPRTAIKLAFIAAIMLIVLGAFALLQGLH
jgi:hypothetical protein